MKVSVYCLVYNHEKYLRQALEGFVGQQVDFEYEVFVHDDASTDGSAAIILEYAQKYPAIIKPILQQKNLYSQGVRIVETILSPLFTGEYVAICEGDDYWCDAQKLQRQVDFLDAHPEYSACVHNTRMLMMDTGREESLMRHTGDRDISVEEVLRWSRCFHTSSVMARRQFAVEKPAFYEKAKGFGDYPLAINLALRGRIRCLDRIMSCYRVGTENSWTARVQQNKDRFIQTHRSVIEMLEAVDVYTQGVWHHAIEPVIRRREFECLMLSGQYDQLRKRCYRGVFREYPPVARMKMLLKVWLPGFKDRQ